eukprot:10294991-Karenia_brevis.AAC.1
MKNKYRGARIILLIDANGETGIPTSTAIGDKFPVAESDNGFRLHAMLLEMRMAAVNTFVGGEPTWASSCGRLRRIDYVAVSVDLMTTVNTCEVDRSANPATGVRDDHYPVK